MSNYTDRERIRNELYRKKSNHEQYHAYCTVRKPLVLKKWNKVYPVDENMTYQQVNPGTTLKIVMVSRLGDFGVTDDLEASHGYHLRLDWDTDSVSGFRLTREINEG